MRVGFVSQYYAPEPGAAAHPAVVAEALRRSGHDVSVLTGFPNYPSGVLYPDYRQSWRHSEQIRDVRVTRTPYFLSHDESGVRRAASMLSFAASASLRSRDLGSADAVLVYASPATTAIPAMLARRRYETPFVLYIQDLWPDTVLASGMLSGRPVVQRQIESLLARACETSYRAASAIAVISEGMKSLLIDRGIPGDKVTVVYNWVDESVFRPVEPDPELAAAFRKNRLTVMYAGGVGELQGLHHAIEAIAILPEESGIHLIVLGEGVAKGRLAERASELGVSDRISFLAGRALDAMPAAMSAADAQLVSLVDLPLFHGTLPSKLQAAMAAGRPVVVSAPGDAGRLITRARAGFAVPPENPAELARAFIEMRDMGRSQREAMGAAGAVYYRENLSESVGASNLSTLLARIAS